MKLETLTEPVVSNVEGAKAFSIDVNGASFRVLSDTLYSDKPAAIIRELACNAWDSHVAAGTIDKQIEISLPNALIPEFVIRDYGTGLSYEDVMELYTTYFRSTKSNSNLFTGALGLGSKSPFCYTDNFIVESFFNGEHYVYQIYLSEDIPSILFLDKSPTQEPNGLRVSFSVPEKDHQLFKVAADNQLFLFKDKVSCYNPYATRFIKFTGDNIYIENDDMILSTSISQKYYYSSTSTSLYATMGNVIYTIDNSLINSKEVAGMNIIFKFQMGEIEFAANRENLSYKTKTINAINDKIKKVETYLKEKEDNLKAEILSLSPIEQIRQCNILTKLSENKEHIFRRNNNNSGSNFINDIVKSFAVTLNVMRVQTPYNRRCSQIALLGRATLDSLTSIATFLENPNANNFIATTTTGITQELLKNHKFYSGIIISGTKENWEFMCSQFKADINNVADKFVTLTKPRHIPTPMSRKEYRCYFKGSPTTKLVTLLNTDKIYYNSEDREPTTWMKIASILIDNNDIPYIYYNGRIQSKLEHSFRYLKRYSENNAIIEVIKNNIIKMRLADALYCKRYLSEEINIICNSLPNSKFTEQIKLMPLYNVINDPDNIKDRLNHVGCELYYQVPEFIEKMYPMLQYIRAEQRVLRLTSKQNSLIDYIRMCEGERNEVDHYKLICNSARRRNWEQIKLRKIERRRQESVTVDREERSQEA